jgi:NADPH-dependent ferric siderophore reductase
MTSTDPIAAGAELLLAHVNGDHADALLLIGQVFGEQPEALTAVAVGVDGDGLDLLLTASGGAETPLRVDFPEPVQDVYALRLQAVALVQLARERSGIDGTTSLERDVAALQAIKTFITSVVRVEAVTPRVRRITFGGGDLVGFAPIAPDQFLYVLLPPPDRDGLTIDSTFTWSAYEAMPEEDRPVGAYYTVRDWRPESAELDMDFVLHTPSGPGCQWAAIAEPGDPAALWGPRTSFEPPADSDWYLLVADDTGLPALSGILESLPPGTPVRAFVEVADADERQPVRDDPAFQVEWYFRDGAEPGTTSALLEAVRAIPWPGGTPYVWGGAESRTLTTIRKHLRGEIGLPREAVSLVGYWRRGAVEPDEFDD